MQADGKILAGGDFSSIGGQPRNRIARLDATTGLADSFDPNANGGGVDSIAVQADGKILAGGDFFGIGGQTRNHIARLDATTGLADSFNPNANGCVLFNRGAGGRQDFGGRRFFTSIGGQTRNYIARLDATTGLADSFDPNANDRVCSIAVQADGKILAGGNFTSIGGQPRSLFARLSNDTAALQDLAVTQTTITWTRGGSSPQFARVTFEYSTDNVNYTPLGNGTAAGSNWTLTGLNSLDRTELLHPRSRLLSQRRRTARRASRNQCGMLFCCANPNSNTDSAPSPHTNSYSDSDSYANTTSTPTPTPTPTPRPATLGNISTRLQVGTNDRVMIAGFIVQGSPSATSSGPSGSRKGCSYARQVLP